MSSKKAIYISFIIFLILLGPLSLFNYAFAGWGNFNGWHMGPGMMGGWGFFGIFFLIIVIVGIVLLVVWLNRKLPDKQNSNSDESALNILKKRYALGEISKEDYEKMKKDISQD